MVRHVAYAWKNLFTGLSWRASSPITVFARLIFFFYTEHIQFFSDYHPFQIKSVRCIKQTFFGMFVMQKITEPLGILFPNMSRCMLIPHSPKAVCSISDIFSPPGSLPLMSVILYPLIHHCFCYGLCYENLWFIMSPLF